MSRSTIWSGFILLTWRLNAAVWTSGVAMVGKWGRFSSQRCLLIYYYQGVGGLGLGKTLAKLDLPNILCLFWKLDYVTGKLIVWRQSIAVVFSLAKPPGFKSQNLTIYISHKIFRSCVCVFVQLNLNFILHLTSDSMSDYLPVLSSSCKVTIVYKG